MPLAGMLASSLTLPLFWLVSVLFSLFLLGCAAWLWLLSWGLCPPGVLATMPYEHLAFFEDMRERSGSHGYHAPGPSASACLNAGPLPLWFPALFSFLVCRSSSLVFAPVGGGALWATSIERHLFFVIQNSF